MGWLHDDLNSLILLFVAILNAYTAYKIKGQAASQTVTQTLVESGHVLLAKAQRDITRIETQTNDMQTRAEAGARAAGNLEGRSEQTAERTADRKAGTPKKI